MVTNTSARDEMLRSIRAALGRPAGAPVLRIPDSARISPREAGAPAAEMALLLAEIEKLGGHTRTVTGADGLNAALVDLVQVEQVKRATMWQTPELGELGLAAAFERLGVEVVAPGAGKQALAGCDLGVTGVDAALPDTGTLCLGSGPERPRMVSLVPRVHLALVRPSALRADLQEVLADLKGERYGVFITGPSRTSDIELTTTIGVHGPKALYVWVLPHMAAG